MIRLFTILIAYGDQLGLASVPLTEGDANHLARDMRSKLPKSFRVYVDPYPLIPRAPTCAYQAEDR